MCKMHMIENMVLMSYLDESYFVASDLARQVETPSKRTVLARDITFVSHRWLRCTMTAKQVNAAIDVFLG